MPGVPGNPRPAVGTSARRLACPADIGAL